MLRIVAGSTLPASPNAESPYRGHLDTLRRFREEDPTTADQRFLEEFGEEYFALVQSVSDGTRGVPPTVEGMERWEQFQDLINQAPELGGWIIGEEGAGEFSRAIFNAQFDTPVEPGSSEMLRELSGGPADWDQERLTRLGWYEYSRQMELIEAARVMMGIPNYQVAAAEPLRQVKRLVVEDIRRRFSLDDGRSPWYEDYTTPDFDKQRRRFSVFRQVIDHPNLKHRPDVQGLSTYIRVREVFAMELLRRKQTGGASTMEAAANLDLRYLWETVVLDLLNDNPAFADMYHRFLEFDVPEASDVEEVISA